MAADMDIDMAIDMAIDINVDVADDVELTAHGFMDLYQVGQIFLAY
jgi:hypothetical protein